MFNRTQLAGRPFGVQTATDIRFCTNCKMATTFSDRDQHPAPLQGRVFDVQRSPDPVKDVVALYDEARMALSGGAASCAVLMFRKILMHVAVEKRAAPRLNFEQYCNYLKTQQVVGTPQHGLLDRIRNAGNQENHQVGRATPEEAGDLLRLVTLLIESIYFAD